MKYLSLSLAPADLKRIYRAFAKLLHPDSKCGNEQEFKILQNEYETCQNTPLPAPLLNENSFDVRMYQNIRFPFGKHKDSLVFNAPIEYCKWVLENCKQINYLLRKALEYKCGII